MTTVWQKYHNFWVLHRFLLSICKITAFTEWVDWHHWNILRDCKYPDLLDSLYKWWSHSFSVEILLVSSIHRADFKKVCSPIACTHMSIHRMVCVWITTVSHAKMTEPTVMKFLGKGRTGVYPINHILDGVHMYAIWWIWLNMCGVQMWAVTNSTVALVFLYYRTLMPGFYHCRLN